MKVVDRLEVAEQARFIARNCVNPIACWRTRIRKQLKVYLCALRQKRQQAAVEGTGVAHVKLRDTPTVTAGPSATV